MRTLECRHDFPDFHRDRRRGRAGAWCRWGLSLWFNPWFAGLPLGTLAANWLGALLMGVCLALFGHFADLPAWIKLGLTTGFLGGLTTFSTFSAEISAMLLSGQWLGGALAIMLHVLGSLVLTIAGLLLTRSLL